MAELAPEDFVGKDARVFNLTLNGHIKEEGTARITMVVPGRFTRTANGDLDVFCRVMFPEDGSKMCYRWINSKDVINPEPKIGDQNVQAL